MECKYIKVEVYSISMIKLKCQVCKSSFKVRPYRRDIARYCSQACAHIGRLTPEPDCHALHKWVNFHLGTPRKCEHCGVTDLLGRRYDWANVSHNYKRDLDDWIRLCKKCHRAFDREYRLNKLASA